MIKDKFRAYLQEHFPFESLISKAEVQTDNVGFNKFRASRGKRIVLILLEIGPWSCGIGLLVSFLPLLLNIWPSMEGLGWLDRDYVVFKEGFLFFDGMLNLRELIRTVSIGGLIGYGTNWLAIRMLFRPVVKRPIWGQGLIPSQRDRIIFTLARGMHTHILSQELIRKRIEDSGVVKSVNDMLIDGASAVMVDDRLKSRLKAALRKTLSDYFKQDYVREEIHQLIDKKLEENLQGGLKRFMLTTYKRVNQPNYEALIQQVIADIPRTVVHVLDRFDLELERAASSIRENRDKSEKFIKDTIVDMLYKIDIAGLLRKQMAHFDEATLEKMVWEATNEQLLYIQYLGTVLGILGGLLIWQPETMGILYVLFFGCLWIIDQIIFRLKKEPIAS